MAKRTASAGATAMDITATIGQPRKDAVAVADLEKLPIERVLAALNPVPGTKGMSADLGGRPAS